MNQNRLFEHITRSVLRRLTLNEEDTRVTKIKNHVIRDAFIRNGFKDEDIDVDKLYYNLRHDFGLMDNKDLPLIRFIAPIAYSDEVLFDIDDSKQNEQEKLKEIARFLKSKTDVFNEIKNKVSSFKDLCNEVESYLQQKKQQEDDELENGDFSGGGNYEILEDVDYETVNRYGIYSCSKGRICYTQSINTWHNFKKKGRNKCYILLRKGWENVEEVHTEPLYDFLPYNAYDEYGLSMIFVFVDPNNDIAYCNTRWNHHADYGDASDDHALNKADLSKVIGKKFSDVFKGYTEEEGVFATIYNAQELLDNGHKADELFDDVYEYGDGFMEVKLDKMWNFINPEGKIISDLWFEDVDSFRNDGFAIVKLDGKYNFINTEGKLVSEQWFDDANDFCEGFAQVKLNGEWYDMDEEGKLYEV